MDRISVVIENLSGPSHEPLAFDALDTATALLVAEINADGGAAELWDGTHRIARLTRHGEAGATFWEVAN